MVVQILYVSFYVYLDVYVTGEDIQLVIVHEICVPTQKSI